MTTTDEPTLLTDEVKALIGQETELEEMYGVVDTETVRRYIIGIPDQDPRHWDEELASPRFGGTTTPPMMVHYISTRKPPWEEDEMSEIMAKDPFSDGGGGMGRRESTLTPFETSLLPAAICTRATRSSCFSTPRSETASSTSPAGSISRRNAAGTVNPSSSPCVRRVIGIRTTRCF